MVLFLQYKQKGFHTFLRIDVRQDLRISDRQTEYNLSRLVSFNFLKCDNSSRVYRYTITNKVDGYLHMLAKDPQNDSQYVSPFLDRANNITLKFKIIKDSDKVPKGFKSISGESMNWKSNRWIGKFESITIQKNNSNVIMTFHEVYCADPHSSVHYCLNKGFLIVKDKLGDLTLDMPVDVVINQHHAISSSELARFTRKFKIFYKSERLTFDHSISEGEFELIHPQDGSDDFLKLIDFFEAVIREGIKLTDLKELCSLLPKLREAYKLSDKNDIRVSNLEQNEHTDDKIVY